jgi:DNA replication protein DnaC
VLTNPTLERLTELRLTGMLKAYQEQCKSAQAEALTFDERLGILVDREHAERYNRSLAARLRKAKLRLPAALEDVDSRQPRGLDKRLLRALASGDWIRRHHNGILTGPTGAGKTYLACALGHQACREGYTVRYHRIPRLFQELALAKGDGRSPKLMRALAKADLLILDDWTTALLTDEQRRTSSRSPRTAMDAAPRSWPPNRPSNIGTNSSATPHSPTPFLTDWCITPTK